MQTLFVNEVQLVLSYVPSGQGGRQSSQFPEPVALAYVPSGQLLQAVELGELA